MNNKLNNNFSLRKLLLTALVAGPLATLPAPLWALPDITSANLTTSSGVTTQLVGSTLNVTSPDKAILTWQAFGSGASAISNTDIINYLLPSATSSVLNTVSGAAPTTIDGSILSNGNVYVLNKSGIIISQTAQINTGGFYASTVDEPSGFFSINGTLSFAGTSTSGVTVQGTGTTTGTNAATIQAVGSGNNIYLAGNTVNVDGGKFFGNVFVRASAAGNNATFGATGPVSVNLVGVPLVGGGLDVRTNGGNAVLSGAAGNTLTIAPAVAATTGAVSINTTGTATNGTITQGAAAVIANTTGSVVTLNAGTGTGAGSITLGGAGNGGVDFVAVGATGNNITLTDTAGGITLNGSTATGTLSVGSASSITQGTGAHSVAGTVTLTQAGNSSISFTGTGNITFGVFSGTPATTTLLTSGDLTLQNNISTLNALSITSSGGKITAANISTSSTLTISAPSSLGNIESSGIIQTGGSASITTPGNISATARLEVGGGTSNITASGGSITLGTLTTTSTVNLSAPAGSITVATFPGGVLTPGAVKNSGAALSLSAPTGTVTTGAIAGSNSLTVTAGTIVTGNISTSSNTTLTASTGTISTGTIATSSTLTLSAPAAAGTISTGALTSTTTRTVTLSSGGTIALNTTTAPVLSVTSTAGSITQTGVVTSTSSAALTALADITLTNVGNDFNTVVLSGGASATAGNGIQITDKNDIVLGSGTNPVAATTVIAGAGIAAYTVGVPTVSIANNITTATATATRSTAGTVTVALATNGGGGGYLAAPTVSFAGGGGTGAAATALINTSGVVTGFTLTNSGSGYTTAPTVLLTAPTGTASTAVAALNPAGVVTGVTVTPGTAPFASAPVISFTPAVGGAGSGAIATATLTNGLLTAGGIVPLQSGSIALGTNAIDTLSFGGDLKLSTTGIDGTNGVTNYSQITTAANNVRIFGNVTVNTNSTNATLGNNTFGNAANYSFGQINGNVGTGTLSVLETQTVNLGAITAGSLDARSLSANIVNTGKLAVTGNAIFAANSIFSPGDVTLNNATNALSGAILIGNAKDFTLVNTGNTAVTAGTALVNGKAATGNVNVTVTGGTLNLGTAAGGDYSTVGFSATGNVVVNDPNGLTLQNATNSGIGSTVSVLTAGPIVLGSGIVLNGTGATTLTSTGPTASISDSAPNIRIFGAANLTSANSISITNAGHSLGAVSLTTTGANGATGTANITYTEGGTANLNAVQVNSTANALVPAGSLTVVSTGGDVIQTALTGSISVPATGTGTGTVSFSSSKGAVSLTNPAGANSIAPVITLSAVGNSTVAQAANIALGNVAVTVGTLSVDSSTGAAATITQAAGSSIKANGNSTFTTRAGAITLSNSGNNFGGLTLTSNVGGVGAAAGADVAITEAGVLNLVSVNTGTAGKLSATSEKAAIIQSGTSGLVVGGATTLTAADAGITLNTATTNNNFGGSAILVTTLGNVSIQDSNTNTVLNGNSNIGGSLVLKNNTAALNGQIKDSPGTLTVTGNVLFDTGTNAGASVSIGSSTANLGPVQFRSGAVTIVENAALNLLAGSVASGAVSLTSSGNIVTSGSGGGTFQNKLDLNASGSITITNPIFVNGAVGGPGLTFRALGAVDLSALSLAGNLNSIAPTNLGASSYKAPTP